MSNAQNTTAGNENKTTTAAAQNTTAGNEKVKVFIPRGASNEDPNFFVSVNGVNYLLPKGKEAEVPPAVAYEIERARKAQEVLDQNKAALISNA